MEDVFLNGHPEKRLPGNLNLSFAYVEAESLLLGLDGIAVSSGSACMTATLEPSHVLRAIGVAEDLAACSIRFGLGRFNTEAEVDVVARRVIEAVRRLRELSPVYKSRNELTSVSWQRMKEAKP
jgi:cysteine desulfurase